MSRTRTVGESPACICAQSVDPDRFRVEFMREFTVSEHTVVPFLNFEWFYDTRYDGWARYQVYPARQTDRQPTKPDLNAIGLNFMWYY